VGLNTKTVTVAVTAAASILATFLLSGCATEVPMQAAEDANNPACADVIVRLPGTVADLGRRTTNAQSTGAWGDPVAVELRCGITPTGPTTLQCINDNGVDWVVDDSNAPVYRFEAYGRSPGLEIYVHSERASGASAISDLAAVVKQLPQLRTCTDFVDQQQ